MTRRSLISVLALVIAVAAPIVAFAQARDARVNAPVTSAPTGTGAISGTVTSDAAPRPLRLATVVLIGATTGVVKVTSTDSDGKFTFGSLPADRYSIGASKLPYLGAVAGARRPARPGTPVVLAAAQKITDVVIRLPLGAAISGTVLDERGQPASAMVSVQQRRLQNGERVLVSVGSGANTDERGRYRIYGLPPGEYVVSAFRFAVTATAPRQLSDREFDDALRGTVPPPEPAPPQMRYVPTYYPGTSRPSDAGGILVAAGDERMDVDVRLETATPARLEGSVSTSDGQTVPNASVLLQSVAGSVLQNSSASRVGQDGRFLLTNVQPGSYVLSCTQSGPQGSLFGSLVVDVAGDQSGLQLMLRPPASLKGRIVFDGTSPAPPVTSVQPTLKSMSKAVVVSATVTPTDPSGNFTMLRVAPGPYMINGPLSFGANANSMTWALQSVTADGKDITDRPIDITLDNAPKDIVLTFTDKWQGVTGKLSQASGAPATDYTVIVFPSDKSYWLTGSRRILTARPDSSGQFALAGPGPISLPPGEYLLAAVTELDRDEQFDPALLASLVSAAVPLTIAPGERKVQDLVIR